MSNQQITGKQVKNETLTGSQIQNNSIDSLDIKDGTIIDNDIASNANISFSKINIPNNTINGNLLIDNSITSDKIVSNTFATVTHAHLATDITIDSTHNFVTDTEKTIWNNKAEISYVDTKIANLVNSAPNTLDTLKELADALGDDPNFATTIANNLGNKVDKVVGKSLSTNDFDNIYKTKLDGIANNATLIESSLINGNIKINGIEKNVYTLPASISSSTSGNAETATKLQTSRIISLIGDTTGSNTFDGSENISITTSLANSGVTAGTYPKLTVNAKGLITSGTSLIATDIPNLDWSKITTGKPTTIAGYNITDAYTKTEVDSLMTNSISNKLTKGGDSPTAALAIGNITNQDFNIMTNNITRINIPATGGANISGGDLKISVVGSTLATPRIIGASDMVEGTGIRFQFGDGNNAWQSGYHQATQIWSFHTLILCGDRDTETPMAMESRDTMSNIGVLVRNTVTTSPALVVDGAASQTGDLQQWRNSSGTILAKITKDGVFSSTASAVDISLSAAQTINNNTWTKVLFNTKNKDLLNEYNNTTYRFTPLYQGRYLITCGFAYVHHDNGIRSITIYKNGVNTNRVMTLESNTQNNTDPVYNYTTTLDLNANDYIEFYTYQNRGGTLNIYNAWATITKIL